MGDFIQRGTTTVQPASSWKSQAVSVRNACKAYGRKQKKNVILNGLNMTVMKNTIYGLLGSSGCGKTTLLSCIVGRRKLDSGEIYVLGGSPGSKSSDIPGPKIGFMPQEISLYGEFTIRETLLYFGWICGMTTSEIDEKIIFLSDFLHLPPNNSFVGNMSGGQQRRVSFAVALLHDPELLILDEPTVGVDPILRDSMWQHLVDISKFGNTTIIITTHYIDEMKQADCIGLMRGGYFLAEETPQTLMNYLGTDNLEDAYLKLSLVQNTGRSSLKSAVNRQRTVEIGLGAIEESCETTTDLNATDRSQRYIQSTSGQINIPAANSQPIKRKRVATKKHLRTLVWKHCLWMWRNKSMMAFIILLPLFQMSMFTFAIGNDPKEILLAVANHEMKGMNTECPVERGCNATYLSCRYLKHLQDKKLLLKYFNSETEATDYVTKGHAYASLTFPANYSAAMHKRIEDGRNVANWNIDYSLVTIYQDKTNQQLALLLWKDFNQIYIKYIEEYVMDCKYPKKIVDIPIHFNKPIYGVSQPNYTDFAAPGAVLTMAFFLAMALAVTGTISERNEGIYERTTMVGVSDVMILLSHVITDFVIVFIQIAVLLSVTFGIIAMTNEGSIFTVFYLTLLTGINGLTFGYFVCSFCSSEQSATMVAVGMMYPTMMLAGMMWPLEGMHPSMRFLSSALPFTHSTEAYRAILHRGWDLQHPMVCKGFQYTFVWIAILIILNVVVIKLKK